MKNIYLTSLLLVFLGACNIKEQSEIQKEVLAEEEIIPIHADSLVSSFARDSSAAVDLYMDKVLSVTGEVGIFEQLDTITMHPNDSLPWIVKWFVNRVESDINTSNIIFKSFALKDTTTPLYSLNATFPREYRKELLGIKEKSKVTVKGRLEYVSTLSQTRSDSTKQKLAYILSLQGCVLEKKE